MQTGDQSTQPRPLDWRGAWEVVIDAGLVMNHAKGWSFRFHQPTSAAEPQGAPSTPWPKRLSLKDMEDVVRLAGEARALWDETLQNDIYLDRELGLRFTAGAVTHWIRGVLASETSLPQHQVPQHRLAAPHDPDATPAIWEKGCYYLMDKLPRPAWPNTAQVAWEQLPAIWSGLGAEQEQ